MAYDRADDRPGYTAIWLQQKRQAVEAREALIPSPSIEGFAVLAAFWDQMDRKPL